MLFSEYQDVKQNSSEKNIFCRLHKGFIRTENGPYVGSHKREVGHAIVNVIL